MAKIRAFRGLRPGDNLADKIAALPYDVVSFEEAAEIAGDNPYCFFHISRAEIDLPPDTDPYSRTVYEKGRDTLLEFTEKGYFKMDEKPSLYLYSQVMDGRMQTGIVACSSIDDYMNDIIKKHELTREDKELDRTTHLDIVKANTGPVFLIHRESEEKKALVAKGMALEPVYDFTADDGIRHIVRIIEDPNLIEAIVKSFQDDILYIADGHHRAASAVRVGKMRREQNPAYTGEEEFNSFLSVIFPENELRILAYNRLVKDLNGLDKDSFIAALKAEFSVEKDGKKVPDAVNTFSMYLDNEWYTLKPLSPVSTDPLEALDVSIVQKKLLAPILGIDDPRKDKRIEFVGGIRGTAELEKLVNAGKFAVAFSMRPTDVAQLIDVSDSGQMMPPKSTWFEPKLRSGLLVHRID